jgi:hypothetical protein
MKEKINTQMKKGDKEQRNIKLKKHASKKRNK